MLVVIGTSIGIRGGGSAAVTSATPTPTGTPSSCISYSGGCTATQPTTTPDPAPVTFVPVTPVAPAVPLPAKDITARDWAKIAKNPDGHVGESIVVYGQVTQFDAATGVSAFRANVDGVKHKVSYGYAGYETNTFLAGNGADLGDLVEKDLFRAEVVVTGSLSYDTTLGGSVTVPQLSVTKLTTIGTAK